ncbi:hypothetical protein V8G54_000743 [Vigna mungo]|uniref:Uncharacterized protein n=1 Tax=Vigna mungo TaxID=3915 RepID=A0AAQ3P5Z2_VIGMU
MRKPCFLAFNPRPYHSPDIVTFILKLSYHFIDLIVTVVVVNEPPLHSQPRVVHNPLAHRTCLVPHHGARAQFQRLLLLHSARFLTPADSRHGGYHTLAPHVTHAHAYSSTLLGAVPNTLRQRAPHHFLSRRDRLRG